ncbi:MAG: zinc metalloprotease HtpX [Nitrospiraceae bacterium]|nr:zinc metalloprotease HtpX [Nitrospiraceae bacterium]
MPLTFIDIERQKTWRIAAFFLVLIAIYLAAILFITAPLGIIGRASPRFWLGAVLVSLVAAGIHFWFSASEAVDSVRRTLDAQPPDPQDEVHRVFLNVIEEVHVVTGRKRTIQSAVIPSQSMNALAVADLRGNALIAITEGLLSRLSRPQVEAVVAHEAHHVLSGDCLETTIAASLFGTLSAALDRLNSLSDRRSSATAGAGLAWLLVKLGYLLNLFISREREYRADAAAVRMTRNPLALAEALHLLSRSWRGAGFIGSGLEMLCIVNPQATTLDETEGFVADLLSTHPPIRKRIGILLAMARVDIGDLDRRADRAEAEARTPAPGQQPLYHAMSPKQEWQGPFTVQELAALAWLSPLTWISTGGSSSADRAWKDPLLGPIFAARLASGNERIETGLTCPVCRQPLVTASYEGTQIAQCSFCAGSLVEMKKLPRIIARTGQDHLCTQRINALARTTLENNLSRRIYRAASRVQGTAIQRIPCPKCTHPMLRGFYSENYLVEVDRCSSCGVMWFDQDELEMLQCMIANRLEPAVAVPTVPPDGDAPGGVP